MTERERQEAIGKFVYKEVYVCQSILVEELFKKEIFSYDDIENVYLPFHGKQSGIFPCGSCKGEFDKLDVETALCKDCFEGQQDPQEIFEWWVVSDWLALKLSNKGEPILETNYGTWWGRTCTGQAIFMDGVIQSIYYDVMR